MNSRFVTFVLVFSALLSSAFRALAETPPSVLTTVPRGVSTTAVVSGNTAPATDEDVRAFLSTVDLGGYVPSDILTRLKEIVHPWNYGVSGWTIVGRNIYIPQSTASSNVQRGASLKAGMRKAKVEIERAGLPIEFISDSMEIIVFRFRGSSPSLQNIGANSALIQGTSEIACDLVRDRCAWLPNVSEGSLLTDEGVKRMIQHTGVKLVALSNNDRAAVFYLPSADTTSRDKVAQYFEERGYKVEANSTIVAVSRR